MTDLVQDEQRLQQHIAELISAMGDDPSRPGLEKTPKRFVNAFRYLTRGYTQSLDELLNGAVFPSDMDEMVIVKNIELYSLCQHHMLPFIGHCHVAYLPKGHVIGLSKIARITELYARRLQVQEQLTKQIAECMHTATQAAGVGVIVEARHLCMQMRGVEKQQATMTTSVMLGRFRSDPKTREEFLTLVRAS